MSHNRHIFSRLGLSTVLRGRLLSLLHGWRVAKAPNAEEEKATKCYGWRFFLKMMTPDMVLGTECNGVR